MSEQVTKRFNSRSRYEAVIYRVEVFPIRI